VSSFEIPAGDRLPELEVQLRNADGPVPVVGATVAFTMTSGARTVTGPATLTDAATGVVSYPWAAGDTDTPGEYRASFRVTFADGRSQTFRLILPVSVLQ
jgi:hypothetical protein